MTRTDIVEAILGLSWTLFDAIIGPGTLVLVAGQVPDPVTGTA